MRLENSPTGALPGERWQGEYDVCFAGVQRDSLGDPDIARHRAAVLAGDVVCALCSFLASNLTMFSIGGAVFLVPCLQLAAAIPMR
jgi:hypothetical protein